MSLDAGGLAQMTYNNNFPPTGGLGLPTAGFASRGKAAQLKRLSVNAPASIPENQETVTTPRTARGHLLAGLRTAPKTPTSAPFGQMQHRVGLDSSRYADNANVNAYSRAAPQTASAATFASAGYGQSGANSTFSGLGQQQQHQHAVQQPQQQPQQQHHRHQHQQHQQQEQHQQHSLYPVLEQPLAPPTFNLNAQELQQMDPEVLGEMMRQSLYLEQKRKLLEQQIQLISLQAQHSQGLTFNPMYQQQFPATPMTPSAAMLNAGLVDEAALQGFGFGAMGMDMNIAKFAMGNNQASQYGFMSGGHMAQVQLANSPPPATPSYTSSPPKGNTPIFRAEVSPPGDVLTNPFERRTPTPPKSTPSPPRDVAPLPPTSANGWRRGHKKVSSLAFSAQAADQASSDGPKSAVTRPVGMPQTPVTGTFGPGQGRAGEHPVRQPRGPPPMDELVSAPTTKHEGSKNFASRQRRGALSKLVRAGMERRGGRTGSAGSMTPVSETDPIFSLAGSDNDSDSGRSLSGKPSIGSLRARASGAIGSERKEKKERSPARDSLSSDEGVMLPQEETGAQGGRRQMPMMLLNSAEKRKNTMY